MIFTGCDPGTSTYGVSQIRYVYGRSHLVYLVDAKKMGEGAKRRWRTRSYIADDEITSEAFFDESMPAWRTLIETGFLTGDIAYVEDIIWYPDKGKPQAGRGQQVLDLAASAGAFEGILGSKHERVGRVPSRDWRTTVLGLSPRLSAAEAEKAALANVGLRLENKLPSWVSGHAAEATAIAIFGTTVRGG